MLIDMHAHTRAISICCKLFAEDVIASAKQAGLDGMVLTNHYTKSYVKEDGPEGLAKRYIEEYHRAAALGAMQGFAVLFGIEVTMEQYPKVHMLIYGVSEQFLLNNPELYELSQSELYALVKQAGGILVQAHPHRKADRLLDTSLMDGIEISCHPLYNGTCLNALSAIAKRDGLILTCGGDYHADTYRPQCGAYIPDTVTDTASLANYLISTPSVTLLVQEVDGSAPFTYTFERTKSRK